jgi:hypothetical protein
MMERLTLKDSRLDGPQLMSSALYRSRSCSLIATQGHNATASLVSVSKTVAIGILTHHVRGACRESYRDDRRSDVLYWRLRDW